MTKEQQAELDAAKEDVVEAAKAWRESYMDTDWIHSDTAPHRKRLCVAVYQLEAMESAASKDPC